MDGYQTLKGVCFFEAMAACFDKTSMFGYQTLKGVCFFEANSSARRRSRRCPIPDAERRLLL